MDNIDERLNGVTSSGEPLVSAHLHSRGAKLGIPVSGTFELTGRCNFSCRMCYIHNADCNRLRAEELPAGWWIDMASQAVEQGTMFLLLTGGEPLIREDFPEIYTELKKLGMIVSINSNGYLLDGEIARIFEKAPPNRINVSLYGTNDDIYEKFTGVRGYTRVIENIKNMKAMGIDVKLNCSITPDNCDDLENIYAISRQLGLNIKATSYMYPPVRLDAQPGFNPRRLTAQEAAGARVRWLKFRYSENEFIEKAENLRKLMSSFIKKPAENVPYGKVRCRAGTSSFWLNKDGIMYPCGMIDEGFDVREIGFAEAWQKVREYTGAIRLPAECENCRYRKICNSCAAVCYTETGDYSKVPEYVCRMSEETARLILMEAERLKKHGN